MKYRKAYKCRLCGKEFYGDEYCKIKESQNKIYIYSLKRIIAKMEV